MHAHAGTGGDGAPGARRPDTAGFTLVEVLISVVLFAVIVNSTLDLLMSQRKLTDTATASISMQMNVRAAVDLLASELRTIPDDAVLMGSKDSVVVRFPYRWGLICAPSGGGSPQPDADLYLPAGDPLFANMEQAGIAIRDDGGTWTYWDDTEAPWQDTLYVESTVTCREGPSATPETGDTAQAGYLRWPGFYSYTGSEAAQGDQVIAYAEVTYRFGESVFDPGERAIFRVTSGGVQELAGFFDENARFAYILEDGKEYQTLPVGQEDDVAQIRIYAFGAVASQSGGEDGALSYETTVDVHLRNAKDTP